MKALSPIILRIGLGLVMIWFGSQQLGDPSAWIGYLPAWASKLPISQINFIYINGWFEVAFGLALVAGLYTRIVAFFLAVHMLGIVCTIGYTAIGVRDFGLFIALVSIFLFGRSHFSVDEWFRKSKNRAILQ